MPLSSTFSCILFFYHVWMSCTFYMKGCLYIHMYIFLVDLVRLLLTFICFASCSHQDLEVLISNPCAVLTKSDHQFPLWKNVLFIASVLIMKKRFFLFNQTLVAYNHRLLICQLDYTVQYPVIRIIYVRKILFECRSFSRDSRLTVERFYNLWLIYSHFKIFHWFQWHINPSRVILCREIKELRLLYV